MSQTISQNATVPSRIDWIDYVKGLTIILVAQMHITLGTQEALGASHMWLVDLVEFARPFRVPLFFMVAGLFVSRSMKWDLTKFADAKFVHFAYFYFLWSAIQIAMKLAFAGYGNHAIDMTDILLLPIEPFSTLWFIHALAIFFMVTRVLKNLPPVLLVGAAAILYAAPIHTGWGAVDEFASRYIFFLAGYFGATQFFNLAEAARNNALRAVAGSLSAFAMVYFFVDAGIVTKPLFGLLAAFGGAAATIALLSLAADRGQLKWLAYVGQRSLYVYLAFFLPGAVMRIGLIKTGFIENADLIALIATVVAVAAPLIGFKLIEKTPLAFVFVRPAFFHLDRQEAKSALANA
ncbi:MAG: acyltransferase family protein [Rhodobiaceae bacterium]|nr:acyltransferase family protein [Rhodobiaceae bacterium]